MERNETRIETELLLLDKTLEFEHIYVQVKSLFSDIIHSPAAITDQTIDALLSVIESERHNAQKQSYFLYKEATEVLIHIAMDAIHSETASIVYRIQKLLLKSHGNRQQALSEAYCVYNYKKLLSISK